MEIYYKNELLLKINNLNSTKIELSDYPILSNLNAATMIKETFNEDLEYKNDENHNEIIDKFIQIIIENTNYNIENFVNQKPSPVYRVNDIIDHYKDEFFVNLGNHIYANFNYNVNGSNYISIFNNILEKTNKLFNVMATLQLCDTRKKIHTLFDCIKYSYGSAGTYFEPSEQLFEILRNTYKPEKEYSWYNVENDESDRFVFLAPIECINGNNFNERQTLSEDDFEFYNYLYYDYMYKDNKFYKLETFDKDMLECTYVHKNIDKTQDTYLIGFNYYKYNDNNERYKITEPGCFHPFHYSETNNKSECCIQ